MASDLTRPGMATVPTAIVTGGNRGLGFEVCRELGRAGIRVILTARRESDGQAAAATLAREGLPVSFRPLDVASDTSIAELAAWARAGNVRCDILVNNAAIALDGFDGEVARRTVETDFLGPLRVTEALLPQMPKGATIVMVSSGVGELSGFGAVLRKKLLDPALDRERLVVLMQGFVDGVAAGTHGKDGWPSSAYRASKAGLNALTRILSRDLAPSGIKVNAVCPGWVKTDMGGRSAPRSVPDGAKSIVWAALIGRDGPTGGFFRDGRPISW